MIDLFVILALILLLAVVALLRFVGCTPSFGTAPPVPDFALNSLDPTSATVGATGVTLTVNGAAFANDAKVQWNGVPQPATQVIDSTKLTLNIDSLIQTAGKAQITVLNPGSDPSKNVISNEKDFTANNPKPELTGFVPPDATVGDPAFELTVNGSNFRPGLTVTFGTTPVSVISVTPLKVQVPATAPELASPGPVTVKVTNPDPSEGPGSLDFIVRELITVLFPGPQPGTGNNLNFDANWGWETGTSDDPISHIFFVAAGLSGTFTFAGPRLLKSMEVAAAPPGGILSVTDNNPSTINPPQLLTIDPVPPRIRGTSQLLTISWKLKSTTVLVSFNNPNSLSIHKITYQGPA